MTGPMDQMTELQQTSTCLALLIAMVLLKLRPSKAQRKANLERLKRECLHERLSLEERALPADPTLDVWREPPWWREMKWKPSPRR